MNGKPLTLRSYEATDEDAAIALWQRTWQQHYPQIDFAARVAWWRERWRSELVPVATIMDRAGRVSRFEKKFAGIGLKKK